MFEEIGGGIEREESVLFSLPKITSVKGVNYNYKEILLINYLRYL
jgi:hypothetical protein